MNHKLRDLIVDAVIDRRAGPLPVLAEELVDYLEDLLVDRDALAEHLCLVRAMRVEAVEVDAFEIADLLLHGVRGQRPDVLARILLNSRILEHLWEMIATLTAELRAGNDSVASATWASAAQRHRGDAR